jgi:hypothetical protein
VANNRLGKKLVGPSNSGYKDKEALFQSGTTVKRFRAPVNERIAEQVTQFVFDHKVSSKLIPDRLKGSLIEATNGSSRKGKDRQATNHNGRSACFGPSYDVELGGSADEPGLAGRPRQGRES